MIPTYLIGDENISMHQLTNELSNFCPKLILKGILNNASINKAPFEADCNALFFLFLKGFDPNNFHWIKKTIEQYSGTLICVDDKKENAYQAYQMEAMEYLLQPYLPKDLIMAVDKAEQKLMLHSKLSKLFNNEEQLLGIPTIEGYEFIPSNEIVKCEGMQSYTRIFIKNKNSIVSSNNIGELRSKLEPFGFFSPHKSYLICLKQIRKYHRDGVICLQDGSEVPLARRRKCLFFEHIMHL